jgi:MFS family permease
MVAKGFGTVAQSWRSFNAKEKRNIMIYIGGIMLYKFGLEAFNGSIIALATNRYDYDAQIGNYTARTFERVGLLTGLYQAFQCVGSILIAPLIVRYPTKNVLSFAMLFFGILTAVLLIVDASSGGHFVPKAYQKNHPKNDYSYYGKYKTDGIIPIYCFSGVCYGMIELIRRVIPRDMSVTIRFTTLFCNQFYDDGSLHAIVLEATFKNCDLWIP